ncbi:MAG: thioredoxin-like domain-containing protein, partial [Cyclobacteriaceae bacterium]|nr:thioredoxin-like domain-containing protein [Cyclobacteriaceae bacterium]
MNRLRIAWIIISAVLLTDMVQAQPASPFIIEGRITDAVTGEPVAFASVGVAGTASGTSSNTDGYFSLRIPAGMQKDGLKIRISCVGYETALIANPPSSLDVQLKQSKTVLKEVVIFGKDLNPKNIVRRAFRNIPRNYYTRPFIYQSFYRHYCKDDSVYGRLIEAAVDIYKRKGYKVQQPFPGWKDEVRVNQLRRSYDNTRVASGHVPIALYSVMANDLVGYQLKSQASSFLFLRPYQISRLKKNLNRAQVTLEGLTHYDGKEIYIINYEMSPPHDSTVISPISLLYGKEKGTLYISSDDYAILKSEYQAQTLYNQIQAMALYRKINDKYFLYHAMEEGRSFQPKDSFTHIHHLELITTDIQTKNIVPFKGREPGREQLLSLKYDSSFWVNYNILKATPLEEKIVADLERQMSLKNQFAEANETERQRYFSGIEDEARFNKYLESVRGQRPVYIDFWASWCGPCLKEMPHSMKLVEKYRGKISFVFLSLDEDPEAWKNAIQKFNLDRPPFTQHFRIGPNSDIARLVDLEYIPRYILVDKKGS